MFVSKPIHFVKSYYLKKKKKCFYVSQWRTPWFPPLAIGGSHHRNTNTHAYTCTTFPTSLYLGLITPPAVTHNPDYKRLPLTSVHCEVLFCLGEHYWAFIPCLIACCRLRLTLFLDPCCLPFDPCLITVLWVISACPDPLPVIWPRYCLPLLFLFAPVWPCLYDHSV